MSYTVREIAELIGGELRGDGGAKITGVSSLEEAGESDVAFIDNPRFKDKAKTTRAACIIASFDMEDAARPVIKCKNPSLAVTKLINSVFPQKIDRPSGIHPTAQLGKNVSLGRDVSIGAYAVLGDDVSVGDGTVIYPLVYVGAAAKIGKRSLIYANVTLREEVLIGDNVIIHSGAVIGADGFGFTKDQDRIVKIPQVGTVEIQDDVEIGACTTIDRARFGKTVVGRGSKIDNLVQIAHNVKIGENCIVAGQAGVSGSVTMGKNVLLGGQVGIADHIEIGDNVMVAAKAGIMKSVPPNMIMSGIPARPHNVSKKLVAIFDNLPKILERLEELESKIKKPDK